MGLMNVVNGRPVAPDVRKLVERFGVVARGQDISHDAIEGLIGAKRDENRYRTVTTAWRKRVHAETGVYVEAVGGSGFRGSLAADQLQSGGKALKSAARKLAGGVVLAQTTPPSELETHEKMRREHMLTNGASLIQAMRSASAFVLAAPPKV